MAVFRCERYPFLMFYVGETAREFSHGEYRTENEKEIEVLEKIPEVFRVDEPETAEEESETEAEGTKKPRRKASAK